MRFHTYSNLSLTCDTIPIASILSLLLVLSGALVSHAQNQTVIRRTAAYDGSDLFYLSETQLRSMRIDDSLNIGRMLDQADPITHIRSRLGIEVEMVENVQRAIDSTVIFDERDMKYNGLEFHFMKEGTDTD